MELEAAKAIGAGLAIMGVIGPGIGIGVLVQGALEAIGGIRMRRARSSRT